ncbi:Hypothetical protein A7982_00635 [Minicystis rosea]|nr:Hypothetical protein A7982_00635 [Minicystis rosea]
MEREARRLGGAANFLGDSRGCARGERGRVAVTVCDAGRRGRARASGNEGAA